jgi:RimJ/RimL family protein N-acetyltransferase
MYLETKRLKLEKFQTGDEQLLFDLDSNPNVIKYVGGERASIEVYRDTIINYLDFYSLNRDCGFFKVIYKNTNEFIGWFHLRPEQDNPDDFSLLELGYRLKEEFWGQGLATEGSEALLKKAFTDLHVDIVSAMAYHENKASFRIMEKIGMSFISEFMFMGLYLLYKYQITKEEYSE